VADALRQLRAHGKISNLIELTDYGDGGGMDDK
jgi:hypothetical protein